MSNATMIGYQDAASGSWHKASMDHPLPVQVCPKQYDQLGHYAIDSTTGSMAAGAASKLIFYAWNSGSSLVGVTELSLTGIIATTAFAAGQILAQGFVARSFTAENGTPGGTSLTLTGNNQKDRTSMATTSMGKIRIATTAALGTPTWTLDSQPFGEINTHSSAGFSSATPIIGSIYLPREDLWTASSTADHPLLLANNEGVAVSVTVPATGVWIAGVRMKWYEVQAL